MSSYRPKSLDELNNMYDKAMSAQKAIQKGSSKISSASANSDNIPDIQNNKPDFKDSKPSVETPIADVSGVVDEFINRYTGSTKKADIPAKEAPKPSAASVPKARVKKNDSSNISSLMSDYVKIMNDQDDYDDEAASKRSFLRHKKEKKKAEKPNTDFEEPIYNPEMPDIPTFSDSLQEKSYENNEAISVDAESNIPTAEPTETDIVPAEDLASEDDAFENSFEDYEDGPLDFSFDDEPEEKVKKGGLRIAVRAILSIFLALSVILTLAVASINTILNVNSGAAAFEKYYFFTSSHDFADVNIKNGDFVICEKKDTLNDGATAVYVDFEAKTFSFGVKTDGKVGSDSGNVVYIISGSEIDRNNVLGSVQLTVPVLGKIVSLIISYYIPVLGALTVLCLLLLIIVVFALRNKNKAVKEKSGKKSSKQTEEEADFMKASDDEDFPEYTNNSNDENNTDNSDDDDLFSNLDE